MGDHFVIPRAQLRETTQDQSPSGTSGCQRSARQDRLDHRQASIEQAIKEILAGDDRPGLCRKDKTLNDLTGQ